MSGSNFQLSNLLKSFYIKQQFDSIFLKEYLKSFTEDENEEVHLEFDFE